MLWRSFSEEFLKGLIEHSLEADPAPKTAHITRLSMYKGLLSRLAAFDGPSKVCLALSHSEILANILGLQTCRKVVANYPEHNMMSLKFQDATFDMCVSDQVLEHIEGNPFKAFSESVRVVKKGGLLVHTTCLINEVHGEPGDFWRFTPDGLKLMAQDTGCEIIEAGGWGNREAWTYISLGFRMRLIPDNPSNPIYKLAMKNEPDVPIHTWVIARKSL